MGIARGQRHAAVIAQALAQATAAWALLAHLGQWPDVSIWVVAPAAAAALVPFRHDGSGHARAGGNFGAAIVLAGMFFWELAMGGLDGLLRGDRFALGTVGTLLLVSTVLFTLAGAMFRVSDRSE